MSGTLLCEVGALFSMVGAGVTSGAERSGPQATCIRRSEGLPLRVFSYVLSRFISVPMLPATPHLSREHTDHLFSLSARAQALQRDE